MRIPVLLTSLQSRLWFAATLSLLVTLLLQLALSNWNFKQVADGFYQQKMQRQAEFLAGNMDWMEHASLSSGDRVWLDEQLEDSVAAAYPFQRSSAPAQISVDTTPTWFWGHRPVTPLDPSGLAAMRDPRALDQLACVCQGAYVATVRGEHHIIQVAVRTEASQPLFASFWSGTFVSVIAALLVLTVFGGWVYLKVTRPLTLLSRRVARACEEGLPYLNQPDEVGTLARALERNRLEAARIRAQELQFLAVASHELRTPLAALLSQLERAKVEGSRRRLDDPRREGGTTQVASLDQAIATVLRIRALGANLLSLSQPVDSRTLYPLDLFTVAAQVVDEWQLLALEKGIELELSGGGAPMMGDLFSLEQLLTNLLSNALNYTDRGHVDVHVSAVDDHAVLLVRDTGRGLPDQWEALTEPFKRGTGISMIVPGTGLGLAVVSQVVRQHQGNIHGMTLPTGGTEITVRFPRRGL